MHACLTTVNVPFRCTAITSSHSCSVMLKTMRSRRIPAQQTTMSSRPKLSMAVCTIRSPPSHGRHRFGASHCGSAGGPDLADHHLSNRLVKPGAVNVDPRINHHHLGAFFGHQLGDPPAHTAARAGDDRYLSFQIVGHGRIIL